MHKGGFDTDQAVLSAGEDGSEDMREDKGEERYGQVEGQQYYQGFRKFVTFVLGEGVEAGDKRPREGDKDVGKELMPYIKHNKRPRQMQRSRLNSEGMPSSSKTVSKLSKARYCLRIREGNAASGSSGYLVPSSSETEAERVMSACINHFGLERKEQRMVEDSQQLNEGEIERTHLFLIFMVEMVWDLLFAVASMPVFNDLLRTDEAHIKEVERVVDEIALVVEYIFDVVALLQWYSNFDSSVYCNELLEECREVYLRCESLLTAFTSALKPVNSDLNIHSLSEVKRLIRGRFVPSQFRSEGGRKEEQEERKMEEEGKEREIDEGDERAKSEDWSGERRRGDSAGMRHTDQPGVEHRSGGRRHAVNVISLFKKIFIENFNLAGWIKKRENGRPRKQNVGPIRPYEVFRCKPIDFASIKRRYEEEGDLEAGHILSYYYGVGVHAVKDKARSHSLILEVAKKGHWGSIGYCHEIGLGDHKKDQRLAVEYYKQGTLDGDVISINNLAVAFGEGSGGLEPNKKVAAALYRYAAELGHSRAVCNLGAEYQYGDLEETDERQAALLFNEAAYRGDATAMLYMGNCYKSGKGVAQNMEIAKRYYTEAARLGEEDAKQVLLHMEMPASASQAGLLSDGENRDSTSFEGGSEREARRDEESRCAVQ
eukprot:CAMPEP_0113888934 /NCGR_PEP_ID=MMETSP0780_2-20120614/13175_1 /TAXON_ID=652834 /ORGANISM="Palpitomonas bilix" /LENGTH=656 /DNA_ID=CAMNT_0000877893 /DNA_START=347 /DNA_END=2318 /DNA_ORIENTATION=- /assembly_acc=CAM_ASM_000599